MANLLKQLELEELSLVDRPANAKAMVSLFKRDNSEEEQMTDNVEKMSDDLKAKLKPYMDKGMTEEEAMKAYDEDMKKSDAAEIDELDLIVAADADTVSLQFGSYRALIGTSCANRNAALSLRASAFKDGDADVDRFDSECLHGSVIHGTGTALVAFRARLIKRPTTLADTYTGQYYDLSPLHQVTGPYLELGRFCQADGPSDMTALRLAWAALSVLVDRHDVRMMIGCSSFPGSDPDIHRAALSVLRTHHLGPKALRPKRLSPMAFDLPEANTGTASLPQLLRSYLGMGGWVSDHAVRDPDLDRLHVFTGLATDTIPETRKARLRALAKAAQITPS